MTTLDEFRPETQLLYGLTEQSDLTNYLSDTACSRATAINENWGWILRDKTKLAKVFNPFRDHHLVTTFGVIDRGQYYPIDLPDVELEDLLADQGQLVLKPRYGTAGEGIEIIHGNLNPEWHARSIRLYDEHVLTDYLWQASYADLVWPHCANTVRLLTMRLPGQPAFIAAAIHRFGTKASGWRDNWNRGGISAAISESGRLGAAAERQEESEPTWHDTHPDTGGQICGVLLPHWDRLVKLCLEMADWLWCIPYVGWDFVITEGGPVLLEANNDPGVHSIQVHGGLLAGNPAIREFYRHHKALIAD